MPDKAYFVIADITGYTAFMTGSELEHAQDILKTLFNTLHDNIKPPLTISNYQGDAILMYAPDGSFIQGQTLMEVIENIYYEFARTLETMHRNTTCTCQACRNIPSLDLKLFVHHGEYMLVDMRGKKELSGPDVIIAHRMMKNEVKEKTGLRAYVLFTEAALQLLELQDVAQDMKPHSESYDHIGTVNMRAHDLKAMWEREREKRRFFVTPEDAWMLFEIEVPASPALVWDYLHDPQHKARWADAEKVSIVKRSHGRVEAGAVHHCAHGKEVRVHSFVDWRPFDYATFDVGLPMNGTVRTTFRLTPTEHGTRVSRLMGYVNGPNAVQTRLLRFMFSTTKASVNKMIDGEVKRLQQIIEADVAAGTVSTSPQTKTDPPNDVLNPSHATH